MIIQAFVISLLIFSFKLSFYVIHESFRSSNIRNSRRENKNNLKLGKMAFQRNEFFIIHAHIDISKDMQTSFKLTNKFVL